MRKKPRRKPEKIVRPSPGPLPVRFGDRFAGQVLVFCDASRKRHGGLAVVIFADEDDSSPTALSRTVAATGSNELELQAVLFGLQQAAELFPGRRLALFTDNSDAATCLNRAREHGISSDPVLAGMLPDGEIASLLEHASIHWLKGHATCRGNILADELAGMAAT